ncbi:MAG: ATP synthase subunit I [Ruthenibacterium sp.]
MKIQPAIKHETVHIGLGVLALSCVMNLVFALAGKWTLGVLWSTLLGGSWAVCNFFLLGMSVQQMAADPNEKRGKLKLQLSYSLRMLGTLAVVVLAVKLKCFVWLAAVLPLFFPRITILIMQMLGLYKPDKTKKEDEPV